jgi:protein-L-isoaspartate O-methyltransferase
MSGPTVVLGMPGYGDMTSLAARGFWRSTRLPDSETVKVYKHGSLLAANFNDLWCIALNLAHQGMAPKYFAMQHSDVGPQDWWLDDMIAELEANDLDILGAAVPIKDSLGLTSIALQRPDGDTWRPLARLTTTEVQRLPETFTSADVGHPLLLNTGLWVCRFDFEWAKKVRFTINDRIVFDKASNSYKPECEPEDWYFSRLLHELGLKVGCTRKIRLMHEGAWRWSNEHPFGQPYDSAWVDETVLPLGPSERFTMPEINGWLRFEEGKALADLARGKRVLEVGAYLGLSTVCMARTALSVVSVDPHDGRGTALPADTLKPFLENLRKHHVYDRVRVLAKPLDRSRAAAYGPYDLVYIDGAHDRASVESDIAEAVPMLAPGGLLAFHDYRSATDPGVTEAVDALLEAGGSLLSVTESLAVVRPPASIPLEV